MSSGFIIAVPHDKISLLIKAELYEYSTFSLSIHPSVDTWITSTFWLVWIMLRWTWVYKCPSRAYFLLFFLLSTLFNKSPEVELLDHTVILFVAFEVQQSIPFTVIAAPCFFFFRLRSVFIAALELSLVSVCRDYVSLWNTGFSLRWLLLLQSMGFRSVDSGVVANRLSCSAACGIFPDQGSNPCPLRWQSDS